VLLKGSAVNVIALATLTPPTEPRATSTASIPEPSHTPADTPTPHSEVSTPVAPTATPIPSPTATSPQQPTATPSPAPTVPTASPTSAPPSGEYLFAAIRNTKDCTGIQGYIRGTVTDSDGERLSGVHVHLYNNQEIDELTQSKAGALDMGWYDFPLGPDAGRFYLQIVDNAGRPLSPQETVDYSPNCTTYVDWQRTR
jgi:hypothetical protein